MRRRVDNQSFWLVKNDHVIRLNEFCVFFEPFSVFISAYKCFYMCYAYSNMYTSHFMTIYGRKVDKIAVN